MLVASAADALENRAGMPLLRLLPSHHGVHFFPDAVVHHGYTAEKNAFDILLRITGARRSIS